MRRFLRGATVALATALAACVALQPASLSNKLDQAKAERALRLWRSARLQSRPVALWELRMFFPQRSDGDMQKQLGLARAADRGRTSQALAASVLLGIGGSTAVGSIDSIPDGPRIALTLALAAAPYGFLSAGLALPDALRTGINSILRLDPAFHRRQIYHEAGHFLVGYMAGLPIEGYAVDAADTAVRFGELDAGAEQLDALACVSMAGVAAEVINCGNAEGGIEDLAQLRRLMARASLTDRAKQDDRVRWATLMALTLLQREKRALDALAAAFERGDHLLDCISALEEETDDSAVAALRR